MPHQEHLFWLHEITFHLRKTWLWEIGFEFLTFRQRRNFFCQLLLLLVNCQFIHSSSLLFVLKETQMSHFYSLQRLKVFPFPFFFVFFFRPNTLRKAKHKRRKKVFLFHFFFREIGSWDLTPFRDLSLKVEATGIERKKFCFF